MVTLDQTGGTLRLMIGAAKDIGGSREAYKYYGPSDGHSAYTSIILSGYTPILDNATHDLGWYTIAASISGGEEGSPVTITAKVTAPEGISYYGQWQDSGPSAWTGSGTVGIAQYSQWSQAGEFDNFTVDEEVTLFTPPVVSIEANVQSVNEGSITPGAYTLRRTGSTDDDLRVNVAIHGTAGMDDLQDYTLDPLPGGLGDHWYTIPAGQGYLEIGLNASADNLVEGDESSIIQLLPGSSYTISGGGQADVVIVDNPTVSITAQGEAHEGQSKTIGDPDKLGFWLRRAGEPASMAMPLTVYLQYGGNAAIGSDVWGVPEQVEFAGGQEEVFVPIGMTEDVMPEWTELFQVRIRPSTGYTTYSGQPNYVSFRIHDDDYFYIGSHEAPDTQIDAIVTESSGESHIESIPLEVVGTEYSAVVGLADGDWLPWLMGAETSGGDPVAALFDGTVGAESSEDAGFLNVGPFSSTVITGEAVEALEAGGVAGDPMLHARNMAILEEYKPGFAFEVTADGQRYVGVDPAGRTTMFDLNLAELGYKGTHHGWYLKFNDDGSIDRWGGEFIEDPRLIGRVRPTDIELKREIVLAKDRFFEAYREQTEEGRIMREQFGAFCDALTALLETTTAFLPGAAAIDIEQAVTGHDPYKPTAQVSGADRAMATVGVVPIVGAVSRGKKLLAAAEQLRENWKAGRAFQNLVTEVLGEVENTQKYKVVLRSGKVYKTIPDIVSVAKNAMIEIKRVDGLANLTPQLEAQILAARQLGMKYRLILPSSATADGIAPVIKDFLGQHLPDKSSIMRFNSETRKLEHLWP